MAYYFCLGKVLLNCHFEADTVAEVYDHMTEAHPEFVEHIVE